jgi:hypothetical protein
MRQLTQSQARLVEHIYTVLLFMGVPLMARDIVANDAYLKKHSTIPQVVALLQQFETCDWFCMGVHPSSEYSYETLYGVKHWMLEGREGGHQLPVCIPPPVWNEPLPDEEE